MPYEKALWKGFFFHGEQTRKVFLCFLLSCTLSSPTPGWGGAVEMKHPGGITQRSLTEESLPIQHAQGFAQFEGI